MRKISIVIFVFILGAGMIWYFTKGSPKPRDINPPAQDSESVKIPDFDGNDYLDDALSDLEAVEGL